MMEIKKAVVVQSITNRNIYYIINALKEIDGKVLFVKNGRPANARSVLGLMSLSLIRGDEIEIMIKGSDRIENFAASIAEYVRVEEEK